MRFNKAIQYGLITTSYIAAHQKERRLQLISIAKECGIQRQSIEPLLHELTKAGILEKKLGQYGGYTLAREPDKISLFDIIKVVDSPTLEPFSILEQNPNQPYFTRIKQSCEKAFAEQNKVLRKITLAEIIESKKK